ncbi:uncharacterized protein M6B38_102585 [Iris pallida]|uniref:Xylanase inhibitor C-terminal domain-containing protein n=1 Tax=Iris pallida TaxID=29817 RepID=A0AAX6G6K6_IRIPA|nr:uncharacterized protein M6B38_102585 [Iris pallida]
MPLSSFFFLSSSFFFLLLLLHFSPTRPESEPETLRLKLIRRAQDPTLTRLDRIRGLVHNDRLRRHRAAASPLRPAGGVRDAGAVGRVRRHGAVLRAGAGGDPGPEVPAGRRHRERPHVGEVQLREQEVREEEMRVGSGRGAGLPRGQVADVPPDKLRVGSLPERSAVLPHHVPDTGEPLRLRLRVLRRVIDAGLLRQRVGDDRPVRRPQEAEAQGPPARCTSSSSGPSFDSPTACWASATATSPSPPTRPRSSGQVLLLPGGPPQPQERHQLPDLRPQPHVPSRAGGPRNRPPHHPEARPLLRRRSDRTLRRRGVLRIPPSVWNVGKGGGAILDSGSSLTMLAEPAYRVVVSALSRRLVGIPEVKEDPFEYCYNWTRVGNITVPKLAVHFAGRAQLDPPVKSYLIDVAAGVKCLGFTSVAWPSVSTIGNIMQQEHLWEFDIQNRRLRFQRSTCTTT